MLQSQNHPRLRVSATPRLALLLPPSQAAPPPLRLRAVAAEPLAVATTTHRQIAVFADNNFMYVVIVCAPIPSVLAPSRPRLPSSSPAPTILPSDACACRQCGKCRPMGPIRHCGWRGRPTQRRPILPALTIPPAFAISTPTATVESAAPPATAGGAVSPAVIPPVVVPPVVLPPAPRTHRCARVTIT